MQSGETLTVQCADGYDLDSQKKYGLCYEEAGTSPLFVPC